MPEDCLTIKERKGVTREHTQPQSPRSRGTPALARAPDHPREKQLHNSLIPMRPAPLVLLEGEVLLEGTGQAVLQIQFGCQFEMAEEKTRSFGGRTRCSRQIQNKTRTGHTRETEECTESDNQDSR